MIQVVELHFEVIICFSTNRKYDFFQFDKATIQEVVWHLKHRFFDLNQFAFWDGIEGENDFKETWEPLRHRRLDITQVEFWRVQ